MKIRLGDFKMTSEMRANVDQALASGRLSPGPFVKKFEGKFAEHHRPANGRTMYGVMSNSGTSSLKVALQALKEIHGWYNGDAVIVPALTFVATINVVLQCGLVPVLVDVNPDDYTIDASQLEAAITPRTKAIMPVHTFGLAADMGTIYSIAYDHDLRIIEDTCEALGATYSGSPVGSVGDISCFSFYMAHHITAGVGGMAVTNNVEYADKMRSLINHGWERETAPMDATEFDFDEIRQRYYFTSVGHSYRPTELEAAIALPQLATLEENIKQRRDNARTLSKKLNRFSGKLQLPKGRYNARHAFMMYPIVLKEGDKWGLIRHLEESGIETREMLPLTNQPVYEGLFDEDDYPVAKWINEQGFYVGCSQYLTDEHMNYAADTIGQYFA